MIDECSMVDAELGRDLMSFGVPVLVLGDPAQLPPIAGRRLLHRRRAGRDADRSAPPGAGRSDRAALDAGARQASGWRPANTALTSVVHADAFDPQRALETDQILVGRNNTRRAYNARMRERRGFDDPLPLAGDKLVCLRNNRRKGLFNGGLWNVAERPTHAAADPEAAAHAGRRLRRARA